MNRLPLSVITITLNEEANIARAIMSSKRAKEVIVVDSGSTDRTCEIAQNMGAKVVHHEWQGYGQQKNFAMTLAQEEWVLFLDADEEIPAETWVEIDDFFKTKTSGSDSDWSSGRFPRKTFFLGRFILHGGWYPNRLTRLVKKNLASWSEPEIHESLQVKSGKTYTFHNPLLHFSFQSIESQVLANLRYAKLGAKKSIRSHESTSPLKALAKAHWKFFHSYFILRGFLDGWPGFVIAINAAYSQFLKFTFAKEMKHESTRHRLHP
jgi:glycosyltransferase involved in cell wall biosynthesis